MRNQHEGKKLTSLMVCSKSLAVSRPGSDCAQRPKEIAAFGDLFRGDLNREMENVIFAGWKMCLGLRSA